MIYCMHFPSFRRFDLARCASFAQSKTAFPDDQPLFSYRGIVGNEFR